MPNHGFTILGWLYGRDFGDRLCKAVNCGYDTDCTGATLGSLQGILGGTAVIPKKWREPVGTHITLHAFTRGFQPPTDIDDLADRTVALAEQAAAAKSDVAFGSKTALPDDLLTRLFRSDLAVAARAQDIHMGVEVVDGREVALHYGGEPVLRPGIGKEVYVTVDGAPEHVDLTVPKGWTAERRGPARFLLASGGPVADRNRVAVTLDGGRSVPFTVLGPREAKGFPAGDNVAKCPTCQARVEACICDK